MSEQALEGRWRRARSMGDDEREHTFNSGTTVRRRDGGSVHEASVTDWSELYNQVLELCSPPATDTCRS
jgi:hypothetical protein